MRRKESLNADSDQLLDIRIHVKYLQLIYYLNSLVHKGIWCI